MGVGTVAFAGCGALRHGNMVGKVVVRCLATKWVLEFQSIGVFGP